MTKERRFFKEKVAITVLGTVLLLTFGVNQQLKGMEVAHAKENTDVVAQFEDILSNYETKVSQILRQDLSFIAFTEKESTDLHSEVGETEEEKRTRLQQEQLNRIHEPYKHLYNDYNKGLLARIIACEYGYQDDDQTTLEHKIAIGRVVLNRALEENSTFPNTVEGVIFQRNQFQPTFDGSWESKVPTDYDKKAALMAFEGYNLPSDIEDALYFMYPEISASKNVAWFRNNLTYVGKMQVHEFYK